MSNTPDEPHRPRPEDHGEAEDGAAGVETTTSDEGGSTFEPEEDPEGHGG